MKAPHRTCSRHGFTLVELSMVIVIIGLLIGGVVGGQALIRSADLKSTIVSLQTYETAIRAFEDKYGGLPGDITNATTYWGLAGGTAAGYNSACFFAQTASSPATCNGNGNGSIDWDYSNFNEGLTGWKQLSNAGLVSGSFTGQGVGGSPQTTNPGVNIPTTKFNNKYGWYISYYWRYPGAYWDGTQFDNTPSGVTLSVWGYGNTYKTLSSAMVAGIDAKIDDGKPAFGNVFVWRIAPDCVDNYGSWVSNPDPKSDDQVNYTMTDTPSTCNLNYVIQ